MYNKIDKRLTADPNANYNIMHDIIEETKNSHMTSKLVKFNKYKHKKMDNKGIVTINKIQG